MGELVYRSRTSRRRNSMLDLQGRSRRNAALQATLSSQFIPDATFGIKAQINLYLACLHQ